jgi:uncharacterized protein YrzB (UPF0473 family)
MEEEIDGEYAIVPIEDDEEYENVVTVYHTLMEEEGLE